MDDDENGLMHMSEDDDDDDDEKEEENFIRDHSPINLFSSSCIFYSYLPYKCI
jgi:hypothetical protein